MKGTREAGTERGMDGRGKEGREEASGGWIERGEGSMGGRERGKLHGR